MIDNIEPINEDETYSPYCKLCEGCGEDGCCDSLSCARKLMVESAAPIDCKYGNTAYNDIEFAVKMYREMYNNLADANSIEEYRAFVESLFDQMFEECYRRGQS